MRGQGCRSELSRGDYAHQAEHQPRRALTRRQFLMQLSTGLRKCSPSEQQIFEVTLLRTFSSHYQSNPSSYGRNALICTRLSENI